MLDMMKGKGINVRINDVFRRLDEHSESTGEWPFKLSRSQESALENAEQVLSQEIIVNDLQIARTHLSLDVLEEMLDSWDQKRFDRPRDLW